MFEINNNTAAGSSATPRLEGNRIHNVKFVDAEAVTVGNDTTYDIVKIKFENEEGSFEDAIFPPKMPDGAKRTANNYGGENPSEVEELMAKIRHYVAALNPELNAQIDAGTKTITAKDWNGLRQVIVKALAKGKGKEVQLKLMKNSKGIATIPGYILSISKAGSLYMRTNFVGDKISFTDKELERISKIASAKPTNVAEQMGNMTDSGAKDDLNFDLEDL